MTINATAMWLLALYQVVAEEQGADPAELTGTTQNDIIKEYLSRGTYVFPPEHSLRLTTDLIAYTVTSMPKWNPINICSLPPAGGRRDAGAGAGLRALHGDRGARRRPRLRPGAAEDGSATSSAGSRSSSTPASGSSRRPARCARSRGCGTSSPATGTASTDERQRRFRYGVQVNSLGLTEAQPENNVQRIVLEMLGVTLSKDARARAVQLPAWNEALGLPRPWDQQWSLRLQQVLAFESDLLEYDDIFDGLARHRGEGRRAGRRRAPAEIDRIQAMGGAVAAVESGYMKQALVASHARRRARIESGEDVVVGVNAFVETEPSPLTADADGAIQAADPEAERGGARVASQQWRAERDEAAVEAALAAAARRREDRTPT